MTPDTKTIPVSRAWLSNLLKHAEQAERDPSRIPSSSTSILIGFALSAKMIFEMEDAEKNQRVIS